MNVTVASKDVRRGLLTIFVDDEPWRDISRTIFGRKPNIPKEVADLAILEAALAALEYAGARRYAIWRLSRMAQSSGGLAVALERALVSEACCQRVVAEFTTAGYINDQDYSDRLVAAEQARGRGPAAARRKLQRKGIDEKTADEALGSMDADSQRTSVQRLMASRYAKRDLSDFKERQKVIASLLRRGFSYDVVRESMQQRNANADD